MTCNRFEAPLGYVAIEHTGDWHSCKRCGAIDPISDECVFCDTQQAQCYIHYRKDKAMVTLRKADTHYFLHTGGKEIPKIVKQIAKEHPNWLVPCWYTDGSYDTEHPKWEGYCTANDVGVMGWNYVKYFQIIAVED